ncbi:Lsr2 family DNA-binding protein, partial [Kineococcus glutinatus]|uniref:Lsr2 family DNA-binding protein n=1 Tax=Kineococcus glutinatus TaxID=1070872 RepID=UPI0031EB0064
AGAPKPRAAQGASAPAAGGAPDSGAVRAWARENGYTVSDRGRISAEIVKAYEDAQQA